MILFKFRYICALIWHDCWLYNLFFRFICTVGHRLLRPTFAQFYCIYMQSRILFLGPHIPLSLSTHLTLAHHFSCAYLSLVNFFIYFLFPFILLSLCHSIQTLFLSSWVSLSFQYLLLFPHHLEKRFFIQTLTFMFVIFFVLLHRSSKVLPFH